MVLFKWYEFPGEHLSELTEQRILHLVQDNRSAAFATQCRHPHSGQPTGINPGKRFKEKVDIKSQTMKSNPMANSNPHAAKLSAAGPDAMVSRVSSGDYPALCSQVDHELFQDMDILGDCQ